MNILEVLYPYSVQLLILAVVMILAGIAGGGKIEILNVTLGNLGIGARIIAGVFGLSLGVLFLLIPRPNFDLSGRVMQEGLVSLERDVEISLSPTRRTDRKSLSQDGSFKFPKITEGDYTIALYTKTGDKLAEVERSIGKGDELLIKVNGSTGKVMIELGNAVKILIKQYRIGNWKQRSQVFEQLARIAGQDESVRGALIKNLQSDDKVLKELSTFALAELGESSTKKYLDEIISDSNARIYNRLRAAAYLMHLFHDDGARDMLFRTVKDGNLELGPRSSAAIHLSKTGTRKRCVIEQIIEGAKNRDIDVRLFMLQRLKMVTRHELAQNYDDWTAWLNKNSNQLEPC